MLANLLRSRVEGFSVRQIDLVEENFVRKADLLDRLLFDFAHIANGQTAVNFGPFLDFFVQQESLKDRHRIGHSFCLDENIVNLVNASVHLLHLQQNLQQIFPDLADDAAFIHFDERLFLLLLLVKDKFAVDAYCTEPVLNDGNLFVTVILQYPVQQCGLTLAGEPSQNSDRHFGSI